MNVVKTNAMSICQEFAESKQPFSWEPLERDVQVSNPRSASFSVIILFVFQKKEKN